MSSLNSRRSSSNFWSSTNFMTQNGANSLTKTLKKRKNSSICLPISSLKKSTTNNLVYFKLAKILLQFLIFKKPFGTSIIFRRLTKSSSLIASPKISWIYFKIHGDNSTYTRVLKKVLNTKPRRSITSFVKALCHFTKQAFRIFWRRLLYAEPSFFNLKASFFGQLRL